MRRRRLLQLGALGATAGALGAGFWALPVGEVPADLRLASVQPLLQGLQGRALRSEGAWSVAAVFNHCAQSIEYSLDGYPELKPAWFRQTLGPAVFEVFSARGAMRHALDQPIPGAAVLDLPADQDQALLRLQQAFERFAAHPGPLAPHFAYGVLSHAEYAQAHVLHLYNHLSELRGLA
ncbi:MAG: DUF1569 domain-containing protein [Pseudomonas sp.]|uniref:DUF1569 domain-containing protein n=1 Tax=Pseudomonas sp. TaxID=306 RepID=UPI00339364B1